MDIASILLYIYVLYIYSLLCIFQNALKESMLFVFGAFLVNKKIASTVARTENLLLVKVHPPKKLSNKFN